MKVAVFGAGGMLGGAVCRALAEADHAPMPFTRQDCNVGDRNDVLIRLLGTKPEAAINCAGARPGSPFDVMGVANTAGPLILGGLCERYAVRLIHVSTDCVFGAGNKNGEWEPNDPVCPRDRYGLTKAAGEPPHTPHVLTVRTSFIGLDHGLLRWLIEHDGDAVDGYENARWNGSTVDIVAEFLVQLLDQPVTGTIHLSSRRVYSKLDILRLCAEVFGLTVKITPVEEPHINRALSPTVIMPPFEDGLGRLAQQWKAMQ